MEVRETDARAEYLSGRTVSELLRFWIGGDDAGVDEVGDDVSGVLLCDLECTGRVTVSGELASFELFVAVGFVWMWCHGS
ncbi:hypothetical protein [Haloarchaeobius amylolyticus]|uniref:hypothetical protein n=1 Tax=Haloarchaeobius amylolyticus TaxID=1198296 RepID=UPI00226E1B3B|nr:hypothetical protein [Haloarchaeobius amylolyticus]